MGVVVFDSDVLIGFLNRDDDRHQAAVDRVRASMKPGPRRMLCAVTYVEIMVGPVKEATEARDLVWQMLVQFSIETIPAGDPDANTTARSLQRQGSRP